MDLWERGLHAGLLGDAKAEGASREGRASSGGEEEDKAMARNCHANFMSGKFTQDFRWENGREGGGCLLPDNQCTKTGLPVAEVLREKHPDMRVPPVETPACAVLEEYGEVTKTVPLVFTEDDVT